MERVHIQSLDINGEGIAYIHKKICFIKGGIPGEDVDIHIDMNKKGYMRGHVVKVIHPSPIRREPLMKEAQDIGWSYLMMDYSSHQKYKTQLVMQSLEKANYKNVPYHYYELTPTHYEQEVHLPITMISGQLDIGIYLRNTKRFLSMINHPLQDQLINKTLKQIKKVLNTHKCQSYNDKTKTGLRFIIVKKVEESLQVIFITGNDGISKDVTKEISSIPCIKSMYFSINTSSKQDFSEKGYKHIYGEKYLYKGKNRYSVKSSIPDRVKDKESEILRQLVKGRVLSLYAQTGDLEMTLPQRVVMLDEVKSHIDDAIYNAEINNNDHITCKCTNIDQGLKNVLKKSIKTLIIHDNDTITSKSLSYINRSYTKDIYVSSTYLSQFTKIISQLNNYKLTHIHIIDEPYTPRVRMIGELKK